MSSAITATRESSKNGVQYQHTYFGSDVEMRGSDGSFARWNLTHFLAVKKARDLLTDKPTPLAVTIDHPLVGKSLKNLGSGKEYRVRKVFRNWWRGQFLVALLEGEGKSHRSSVIDGQTCLDPDILAQAQSFEEEFVVRS